MNLKNWNFEVISVWFAYPCAAVEYDRNDLMSYASWDPHLYWPWCICCARHLHCMTCANEVCDVCSLKAGLVWEIHRLVWVLFLALSECPPHHIGLQQLVLRLLLLLAKLPMPAVFATFSAVLVLLALAHAQIHVLALVIFRVLFRAAFFQFHVRVLFQYALVHVLAIHAVPFRVPARDVFCVAPKPHLVDKCAQNVLDQSCAPRVQDFVAQEVLEIDREVWIMLPLQQHYMHAQKIWAEAMPAAIVQQLPRPCVAVVRNAHTYTIGTAETPADRQTPRLELWIFWMMECQADQQRWHCDVSQHWEAMVDGVEVVPVAKPLIAQTGQDPSHAVQPEKRKVGILIKLNNYNMNK